MEFDELIEEPDKPYNIRHRCYYFAKEIIWFIKECNYDRVYFSMFDQLVRSGTSIGANLVEGRAGSTKKDWKNFM
jgi:four helix bundle protein